MQLNDDLNVSIDRYVIESLKSLRGIEENLSNLENDANAVESLFNIFRTIHTISTSANQLGLNDLFQFTQVVDNFLEQLQRGNIDVSGDLIATLTSCFDHIGELLR